MLYFSIERDGIEGATTKARDWRPDVCLSNQVGILAAEQALLDLTPIVKVIHGHYGTCIGGHKMHLFPTSVPCDRTFGPACLALYLPRHCGQLSVRNMLAQYSYAREQNSILDDYASLTVTSEYMKGQYVLHGVSADRIDVNPLFPTIPRPEEPASLKSPESECVLFLGRMTASKGGSFLVRAVHDASRRLGRRVQVVMAGDGYEKDRLVRLATELDVDAVFPGWVDSEGRAALLRRASLLAVPSVWHEPFGLVGLEGGRYGVPSVAFDVGGISAWLRHGVNGLLVPARPPQPEALGEALATALGDRDTLDSLRRGAIEVAETLSVERHVDALEHALIRAASSPRRRRTAADASQLRR